MSSHENPITLINSTLMHHQQRLDNFSEQSTNLKIEITEIKSDIRKIFHEIKNINVKFVSVDSLSSRIEQVESYQHEQKKKRHTVLSILKMILRFWWIWPLIIFCIFAFDLKIEVQNPHLVNLLMDVIKNKL